MNAAHFLIWGAVALAVILLGALMRNRGGGRRKETPNVDAYAQALSALINGDRREALRLFKEAVQNDSNNVDAYLRLGDLLREGGETERALAIHRELTVRAQLPPADRARILESLTRDYLAAGRHREAGESAEKLRTLDRRSRFAPYALQEVAEALGDWSRAVKVMESRLKDGGERDKAQLARYRGYVGSQELAAGRRKEARQHFQEALKLDSSCVLAHVALGDLERDEGNLAKAVDVWRDMALRYPQHAGLVFDRLERAAFELGEFGEMTNFYRQLLHRTPREVSAPAILALAEIHRRRGDFDDAESFIQEVLEIEPNLSRAHRLLAKVALDRQDAEAALAHVDRLLRAEQETTGVGVCRFCARSLPRAEWRCPHCRGLNPLGL